MYDTNQPLTAPPPKEDEAQTRGQRNSPSNSYALHTLVDKVETSGWCLAFGTELNEHLIGSGQGQRLSCQDKRRRQGLSKAVRPSRDSPGQEAEAAHTPQSRCFHAPGSPNPNTQSSWKARYVSNMISLNCISLQLLEGHF